MIYFNKKPIDKINFPNGEVGIKTKTDGVISCTIGLKWESDQDFIDLLFLKEKLPNPTYVSLDIYYMPYSRMDRKIEGFAFTLKSICGFINSMNFDKVTVFEPHSDVTPALLNNCEVLETSKAILSEIGFESDCTLYPDAGAYKRYKSDGHSDLVAIKERDLKTGRIKKYNIIGEVVKGSVVIIIDDLCSKGGTFDLAAKELKRKGAGNIYLVVAHCENSIFDGNIFKNNNIKKVFTTNSIVDITQSTDRLHITDIIGCTNNK